MISNPSRRLIVPCKSTVTEWFRVCKAGGVPASAAGLASRSEFAEAVVCLAAMTGALEPLDATRPSVCTPVTTFERTVEVPPATTDPEGNVVPSQRKLIKICAPLHQSLVVDDLDISPANLTATESGEIVFPRNGVFGFSEGFCFPFEPGDGNDVGVFYNVNRIVLCPGSGFDVHGRNNSPFSNALFHVKARLWGAC